MDVKPSALEEFGQNLVGVVFLEKDLGVRVELTRVGEGEL